MMVVAFANWADPTISRCLAKGHRRATGTRLCVSVRVRVGLEIKCACADMV